MIEPDKQAAVILHILLSNCEHNSGGGLAAITTLRAQYSVLGMPRSEEIPFFDSVWVRSPDSCPRSAPVS